MQRDLRSPPGLGTFWEQADFDGSEEHPLERELCERLDALARYARSIAEAQAAGREYAMVILVREHAREEEQVARIRAALQRMRDEGEEPGPASPFTGP